MTKYYNGTTVNDFYNALYKDFNQFVDTILNYESDTFSASSSDLTPSEAEQIALAFILEDMRARNTTQTMDGGMISEQLQQMRESNSKDLPCELGPDCGYEGIHSMELHNN